MKTKDIPLPLVKNLLTLHESAAPGTVRGFTKNAFKADIMDEVMSEVLVPLSRSSGFDVKDPEKLMEAFYANTFLRNEDARECLVYSQGGHVVGMAQIGKFRTEIDDINCTISNLVLSPKISAAEQSKMIKHIARKAKASYGEATLISPEPWGKTYETHGFRVEPLSRTRASDPKKLMVKCHFRDT